MDCGRIRRGQPIIIDLTEEEGDSDWSDTWYIRAVPRYDVNDSDEEQERVYQLVDPGYGDTDQEISSDDEGGDYAMFTDDSNPPDVTEYELSDSDSEPPGLTDGTSESEEEDDEEDDQRSPRRKKMPPFLSGVLSAMYLLSVVAMWTSGAYGLVVYDCSHPDTTIAAWDMVNPAVCQDMDSDYDYPVNQKVQILQTQKERPITAKRCRIKLTKDVTRCGFNGVTYATQTPVFEEIYPITEKECLEAWKNQQITFSAGNHKVPLKIGSKVTTTWISHGSISDNAMCYDEYSFVSGGRTFWWSYETTMATVELSSIHGTVDLHGIIRFPGGLLFNQFHDGSILDNHEGRIVWEAETPRCHERVSSIYHGNATLRAKRGPLTNDSRAEVMGAILMLNDDAEERAAGLLLRRPVRLCGKQCYSTQVEGVVACLLALLEAPILHSDFLTHMDSREANVQTQMGFLHLSSNIKANERFKSIQGQICAMERKGIHTKLQMAAEGNKYAFLDVFGKGHHLMNNGASIYVSTCAPINVTRADPTNCTNEIPVIIGNQTVYADPLTFVVQEFPTIRPCSEITPTRWRIQDTWYCSVPEVSICDAPNQFAPDLDYFLPSSEMTKGLGNGLWTKAQMEAHRDYLRTTDAHGPVEASLTHTSVHNSRSPGKFGPVLRAEDISQLEVTLGDLFFPFYSWVGTSYVILIGIFGTICVVEILCGGCVRCYVMFIERGCGPWIIGACWTTTFSIFRAPYEILHATVRTIVDQPQQMIDEARARVNRRDAGKTYARRFRRRERSRHMLERGVYPTPSGTDSDENTSDSEFSDGVPHPMGLRERRERASIRRLDRAREMYHNEQMTRVARMSSRDTDAETDREDSGLTFKRKMSSYAGRVSMYGQEMADRIVERVRTPEEDEELEQSQRDYEQRRRESLEKDLTEMSLRPGASFTFLPPSSPDIPIPAPRETVVTIEQEPEKAPQENPDKEELFRQMQQKRQALLLAGEDTAALEAIMSEMAWAVNSDFADADETGGISDAPSDASTVRSSTRGIYGRRQAELHQAKKEAKKEKKRHDGAG